MRKRSFRFLLYLSFSIIFGLAVMVFQGFRWSYGHLIYNTIDHAWDAQIKSAELACSITCFVFASLTFIGKSRKRLKDKDNVLYLVLLFLFFADLFFLVADFNRTIIVEVNESLGGFICQFIAFAILMSFWKPKLYEYLIRLAVIIATPFLYYLVFRKYDAVEIMAAEVGMELLLNVIFASIHHHHEKSHFSLYILLGTIFAFASICFVGLRTITKDYSNIANTFAILVWPLHITSCVFFNHVYRKY